MFVAVNRIRCKASVLFRGYKQQMATEDVKYNEAVQTLNEMQCNRMLTSQQKMNGMGLVVMRELLHRINISNDDLNQLKIIHITGTKGKGSTCAFVDNILRKHGVKTGFYSSPHLLEVRERIRVNGRPISTDLFTQYFWEVFDLLKLTEHNYEVKVPSYFYMLTALALYVFKHEHVSAAILEVGIGGAYDCTNVVPNPVCCGVASLGLDHTDLLGNTLGEIAWQKGGIFKRGAAAFTVPQPDEGMKVLHQRADEVGADLKVAPPLDSYPMGKGLSLGLSGDHQMTNASLAVQLANSWLNRTSIDPMTSQSLLFPLSERFREGLRTCRWNGRGQVIKFRGVTFYLDGAHTVRSLNCSTKWFVKESSNEEMKLGLSCDKILAFNVTSNRDVKSFLEILFPCGFSSAIFVPNIASHSNSMSKDQTNLKIPIENQIFNIFTNRDTWREICTSHHQPTTNGESPTFLSVADAVSTLAHNRDDHLYQTVQSMTSEGDYPLAKFEGKHLQVFVTGSLYLVGAFLAVLKPDLND